ncbi:MAG: cation diffusion facilitator family transporter [Nitrospiraceae bacterium]|nr:cation diffusion facilitator family transporter [Nitrospiraceae bacterium]
MCPDTGANARTLRRVTVWGLAANLCLAAIKFVFGIVGASQALVADAVHSLSDSTTDLAILIGAPYWSAPADSNHPYGHGRIETMVTLAIGAALAAVGVGLGYNAVATLKTPDLGPPGWSAFAAACLSIIVKEGLYRWTAAAAARIHSSAMAANAWHHRSDAFSSVPVAIAVIAARIAPDWSFLDHVAALIVSLLILQAAWKIAWPTLNELADRGADAQERKRLTALALETPGVHAVHALRARHIGAGLQVDLHVLVEPDLTVREGHDIAGAVRRRLTDLEPTIYDVLVHIEPHDHGAS